MPSEASLEVALATDSAELFLLVLRSSHVPMCTLGVPRSPAMCFMLESLSSSLQTFSNC